MENYEQLVRKFNELVDKISAYEVLVEKQQNNAQEKLLQMQEKFDGQQKAFSQLEKNINLYELMFKESFGRIVDILNEKLIFSMNKLNEDKIKEIENVVQPLSEIYKDTNNLLTKMNQKDTELIKKTEQINFLETKATRLVEKLSKVLLLTEKVVDDEEFLSAQRKVRNELIEVVLKTKSSPIETVNVTKILQKYLNEIEQTKDSNELNKIYNKAVIEIQIALMENKNR